MSENLLMAFYLTDSSTGMSDVLPGVRTDLVKATTGVFVHFVVVFSVLSFVFVLPVDTSFLLICANSEQRNECTAPKKYQQRYTFVRSYRPTAKILETFGAKSYNPSLE